MRARRAAAASSLSPASLALLGLGAALGGCFDLFHSTADLRTACEIDNASAACAEAGAQISSASPSSQRVDFCAWGPPEARQKAERACAWLGACETPMGGNAFGPCMFQALMAYDCASNPNHRPKGKALDLWECLLGVNACGDVDSCIFPAGPQGCPVGGVATGCGSATDSGAGNADVRTVCAAGGRPGALGENCSLWGKTCASDGTSSACTGDPAGFACAGNACVDSVLRWCVDAGGVSMNVGIDCASNGARRCDTFPTETHSQWAACVAEGDAGAAAGCAPSTTAICSAGLAVSCPSGVPEVLDCATLLGSASACSAGPLEPAFDWTSACAVSPPACTRDACGDGGVLTGCARGASFSLDCGAQRLGACRMVNTDTNEAHAACGAPWTGKVP